MNLAECRAKTGMRQQDVADKLGVSLMTYGSWERETRSLSFEQAIQLADLFGCTLDELAGRAHRAEIITMDEPPVRTRARAAFERLNSAGREALADTAESFLRIPAFVDSAASPARGGSLAVQAAC